MRAAVICVLAAYVVTSVGCSEDKPLTDERASSFVTTTDGADTTGRVPPSSEVTTTDGSATTVAVDRDLVTVVDGWQRIDAIDADDLFWVESLPAGGFVAGSSLRWSPDGLNWFDGDPQELAPRSRGAAVVGDQVIILVDDDDALALWIGDPATGSWNPMMDLDTSGLELVRWGGVMAAGDDEVLVAAITAADMPSTADDRVEVRPVVWLVDPVRREATRRSLAVETLANHVLSPRVWFDDRWHLMLPLVLEEDWIWSEIALWSSPDGTTWNDDGLPEGMNMPMLAVDWITTGSSGVVICADHEGSEGNWFSPNGVDWEFLGPGVFGRGVYSESLGYVLEKDGREFSRLSPDGKTLEEEWTGPFPADTVAASGDNLIVDAFRGDGFTESESAGVEGLWLYHEVSGID